MVDALRREYSSAELIEQEAPADALELFASWYEAACRSSEIIEPNTMVLATVDGSGQPAARAVLLKSFDHNGFVFVTNYQSRKGKEISDNNRVAAAFVWNALERQVRIEGRAVQLTAEQSDQIFAARPRGAQLAAHASRQSTELQNRAQLDQLYLEAVEKFGKEDVSRPSAWGGYAIRPERIEFWQGRANRMSDRLLYSRTVDGNWQRSRLAP